MEPIAAMNGHPDSDQRLRTTCLVVLTLIASGAALYFLRPVVVPFLLAIVVLYALQPLIDWQHASLRFPRWLAILGAGAVALALLALIGVLGAAFVFKLREHLPDYEAQLKQMSDYLAQRVDLGRWGLDPESWRTLPEYGSRQVLGAVLSSGADMVSSGGLVLLFVLFMIGGSRPNQPRSPVRQQIDSAIRGYILNMIGLSALTGVLVWFTLSRLKVDFALEFGVLAFLLNFIPTIGSIIATLLPLPVVLLSPQLGVSERILAIALPSVIQIVLGSVVQPRVVGKSQDLHPVAVLLSMVFFGTIWGVIGAVLAAPIAGVLRIVFSQLPATKPFADMMSGGITGDVEPAAMS